MPYIERNQQGQIVALHRSATHDVAEHLPATSPEVVAFLESGDSADNVKAQPKMALAESDADIARVTEDLINLLIAKNIILFTELPDAVQQKLLAREKLRSSLGNTSIDLLHDSDTI